MNMITGLTLIVFLALPNQAWERGPFFWAEWKNPNGQRLTDDNITINIIGDDRVEIIRGGESSASGCTYTGKIFVGWASGEYSCNGRYAGTWSAVIRL